MLRQPSNQSQFNEPLPSLSDPNTQSTSPNVTVRTWIGAIILSPLVGLLLGAITTGIGTAVIEVYAQTSSRPFGDLFEMLTSIVLSLISVLALASSAIGMGAQVGLYCGSAISIVVLLIAFLNGIVKMPLRLVTRLALAIAGAVGAWYGATSSANDGSAVITAFVVGGALFGFFTAQSILPRRKASGILENSPDSATSFPRQERHIPTAYIIIAVVVVIASLGATFAYISQRMDKDVPQVPAIPGDLSSAGIPVTSANAASMTQVADLEIANITDAIFSSDGMTIAVASGESVQFLDAATLISQHSIHTGPSQRMALSPDGAILATLAGHDVKLWRIADQSLLLTLAGHTENVEDVAFSPDGSRIATASLDRSARIWRADSGELLFTLAHVGEVHSLAFNATGDQLVTGSSLGTTLWRADTGDRIVLLDIVFAVVHDVAFSPDSTRIAAAMNSGIVRLWDGVSHVQLQNWSTEGEVSALVFNSDGSLLAVGGADQMVRLWNVSDGKISATLSGHQGALSALAFDPKGQSLLSVATDGTLRLWRIAAPQ